MEATICAPKPPNPKDTAAASTGTNVSTAIANAMMGNVNQITPDGTLSYETTGSHSWADPYTGQSYEIPTFTATQTLSPEQQAIRDQTVGAQTNLAGLANDQSAFLRDYLNEPFSYTPGEHEGWALGLYDSLNADAQGREMESLRSTLLNRGLREGTEAYNAEMRNLMSGRQTSRDRFLLDSYGTGMQTALTSRNQPINEVTALLSGSQVSQPNFINPGMPTIPTTDTAGIINNHYQQQMAQWGANQGLLGGVMGGVGKLISLSDERAKKDKRKIGHLDSVDLDVHEYRYKGEPESAPKRLGLMAQEVERKNPSAVIKRNGIRYVDYGRALAGKKGSA